MGGAGLRRPGGQPAAKEKPDRILMETMEVISELVRTDTVAIYRGQAGNPWLRLAGSLCGWTVSFLLLRRRMEKLDSFLMC